MSVYVCVFFFFQAEDGIRDYKVTGVQTCALPICCCPPERDELQSVYFRSETGRRGYGSKNPGGSGHTGSSSIHAAVRDSQECNEERELTLAVTVWGLQGVF